MNRPLHFVILLLGVAAVALHSPGQWSFDSVVALGEASTGAAVGWGSTFFAALLRWLGGGEVAGALFVALMAMTTVLVLIWLAPTLPQNAHARPIRIVAVWLIALNPVWWLYAGILWKDVLLALAAAATVFLLDRSHRSREARWLWLIAAILVLAALPLIRQQGIILTAVIGAVFAWRHIVEQPRLRRLGEVAMVALCLGFATFGWSVLVDRAVNPVPKSPFSVGVLTIMSYDVLGVVSYSRGDLAWADADSDVIERVRRDYSPERIDIAWQDARVASWIQQRDQESLRDLWVAAVKNEPLAYVRHRADVARHLFGLASMQGCVASYWGVAGPAEILSRLGVQEAMDPRDRMLGRWSKVLMETPVLRHWFYVVLLCVAAIFLVSRRRLSDAPAWAAALASSAYALSFLLTAIACDFRYLFPSAVLAMVACLWLLSSPDSRLGSCR